MRKRTLFRLFTLVNLIAAWEWYLEGLGIGVSVVSCVVAGIFLLASFHRRRLRVPGPGATPKEKAEYNLLRVARLVHAEEIAGGWEVRSGGRVFQVYNGYIRCAGQGQTCYQSQYAALPTAEKIATALLYLHRYPEAWQFWAQNHGRYWTPTIPVSTPRTYYAGGTTI